MALDSTVETRATHVRGRYALGGDNQDPQGSC